MFVFGEIQDPNHETVNLVEDIVRSQLIELVWNHATPSGPLTHFSARFFRPAHSPTAGVPATSRPKTSSSSSDTTEAKSTVCEHTSHGKTSASMPKTVAETVAEALKSKRWRTVQMVCCVMYQAPPPTPHPVSRQTHGQGAKDHHQAPLGNIHHLLRSPPTIRSPVRRRRRRRRYRSTRSFNPALERSRRRDPTNDARRVPALFRLSTSEFHLSQRCVV